MGLFRGNFKSKTARYPESIYLDLPERLQNKRNVLGSQLGNTATQSSVTGGVKGYGVNLAEWITWAINEGKISITGADTNLMNTSLTSTVGLAHTIDATSSWSLTHAGTENFELQFTTAFMDVGHSDEGQGRVRFTTSGIEMQAYTTGHTIQLGDTQGDGNSAKIEVDDGNDNIDIQVGGVTRWGDLNSNGSGQVLYMDGSNGKLQYFSTAGGVVLPRMTAIQASAIGTPLEGEMVVVTSTDATFTSTGVWIYEGAAWGKITVV